MKKDLFIMYRSTKVHFVQDGYFCRIKTGTANIDADGAPNAYGPPRSPKDKDGCGLDSLVNACYPPGANDPLGQEDWTDILVPDPTDPTKPFLKSDGYYISKTALCDESKSDMDAGKFLDAASVSYIVMPQFWIDYLGMKLGGVCVLMHPKVLKPVVAIIGDICPFTEELGEMSIRTALNLGATDVSPRGGSTWPRGEILCRMFKGVIHPVWPVTDESLQAILPALAKKHAFDPHDPKSYTNGLVKADTDA